MPTIDSIHVPGGRASLRRILQSALQAADPIEIVSRSVRLQAPVLFVPGGQYDLSAFKKIHLLSLGKAGLTLARALNDLLGDYLSRGLVITKNVDGPAPGSFKVLAAGHPVPDE